MNKKAIMLEFLIRLIIAIVFIGSAFYIGSKLFRLGDKGYDDYNKLTNLIDEMKVSGEIRSLSLSMDQDTAIVGFSSNDDYSVSRYRLPYPAGQVIFIFRRSDFPACIKDKSKSCVCLVTKPKFDKYGKIDSTTEAGLGGRDDDLDKEVYKSLQIYYKPEEESKFYCADVDADINFQCDLEEKPNDEFSCSHGFVLERGIAKRSTEYPQYLNSDRTRGIYLENYQGKVIICLNSPCLSDITKKEIDQEIEEKNKEKSIEIFNAFIANFGDCIKNVDCKNEFMLDFPSTGFKVKHGDDSVLTLQMKKDDNYENIESAPDKIYSCDGKPHEYEKNAVIKIAKDIKDNYCMQQA